MTSDDFRQYEETLDPENWDSMRLLGHKILDDMMDYLREVRKHPVWCHMPDEAKAHFTAGLPLEPQSPEEIYKEFLEYVLPFPVGNIHPRFWGWVLGTGTVFGALAEVLSSFMNTNTGGIDHHSANYVEKQVIEWFKELLGFPQKASGLLTSGCSAANLIALAVARNSMASIDLRRHGMTELPQRLTLYASEEIHSSVQKAAELLGLGSESTRLIPVNNDYQVNIRDLEQAIAIDRREGSLPFCIVGAAGTTNTGAFDDLNALADLCQKEKLWFHVDGAFGAWAALVPNKKDLIDGMDRADSLAFDLHKWMYMPYEIGCILIRSEGDHRQTFTLTPSYLDHGNGERGMTGGDLPWFSDYGFQLSRGFRALKAWMSLKEHGVSKYGRLIEQNIDQARYLADLVLAESELELMAPVPLNVVVFRFKVAGMSESSLDDLNRKILIDLQEAGIAVPSGTQIKGRFVIHVAITNHRSRRDDFDLLVREVIRIGGGLAKELPLP